MDRKDEKGDGAECPPTSIIDFMQSQVGDNFDDDEAASIDLAQVRRDIGVCTVKGMKMALAQGTKYARVPRLCTNAKLPRDLDTDLCVAISLAGPRNEGALHLVVSGARLLTLGDGLVTTFVNPINLVGTHYHEFAIVDDKGKRFAEPFIAHCIAIMDEKLHGAFMRGSKRLLYTHSCNQKEPVCIYRGMVIPASARRYVF